MINCPRCNSQVPDGTSSCPSCGYQFTETNVSNSQQGYNVEQSSPGGCQQTNFTPYSNNVSHQQPTRTSYTQSRESYPQQAAGPQYQQPQPNYGPPIYPSYPVPTEDKANVGLCILSVFFPIFGIIYYFCTKSKKPKEAKGCLKAGLISAGVNFLLYIIIMIVAIFGAKSIINTVMEETDNSDIYYEENYEDEDISFDFDLGEDDSTENSEDANNNSEGAPEKLYYSKGTFDGYAYVNKWADIKFTLPEGFSDADSITYMSAENSNTECGMYFIADDTMGLIYICYEKLSTFPIYDEEKYLDSAMKSLENVSGVTYKVPDTYSTATIGGYAYAKAECEFNNKNGNFANTFYVRKLDDYMIVISAIGVNSGYNDALVANVTTAK